MRTEASNRASGHGQWGEEVFQPDGPMRGHRLSMMAGALGLGVVLGMVSEGLTADGGGRPKPATIQARRLSRVGGSSGFRPWSSVLGPAAVTAQNELQDLIKEGFATLKGRNGNGASDTLRQNRDVGVE